MLVGRVTSDPCIEADSVRVSRVSFPRQQAVDLGFAVHGPLVAELRRRQTEDGLIWGGAQLKVPAHRLKKQRGSRVVGISETDPQNHLLRSF